MTGEGIPPGARRIDPDAEVARLAEERKRATEIASWPVIVEEVQQIAGGPGGDSMIFVHLRVTADRLYPVPSDLGAKLVEALAANWPVRDA